MEIDYDSGDSRLSESEGQIDYNSGNSSLSEIEDAENVLHDDWTTQTFVDINTVIEEYHQVSEEEIPSDNKSSNETQVTETGIVCNSPYDIIQELHAAIEKEILSQNILGYENQAIKTEIMSKGLDDIIKEPHQASTGEISPENTLGCATQAIKTDTFKISDDIKIEELTIAAGKNYISKGKAAVNPKFRYSKSSRSNASSTESSPAKDSKVTFNTPESKSIESQSPKAELIRISPAAKRKEPDSSEEHYYKHHSAESYAKRLNFPNISENQMVEENFKIVKKLKFKNEEKDNKKIPRMTELISESLMYPSSRDINVVDHISSSEETSGFEDLSLSDTYESSLASESVDVSHSDLRETSFTDVSDEPYHSEMGKMSIRSVSEDVPHSKMEESSFKSLREDVLHSEILESSFLSVREDVPHSEREESSITSVFDVPHRERGEFSFTSLSEDVPHGEKEEPSFTWGPSEDVPQSESLESSTLSISENVPHGVSGESFYTSENENLPIF